MVMKQLTVMFNGKVQKAYLLDVPRVIIGRGGAAQISLENNPFVSRQHAAITFEGATHVLQDLGGPNGTFVGEQRVRVHPLMNGERILLGRHSLRYEEATPQAESLEALNLTIPEPSLEEVDSAEVSADEGWQDALPQSAAKTDGPASAPARGGYALNPDAFSDASTTVAASKAEIDEMVRRMALKEHPHLSVSRESGIELVLLKDLPFRIGWAGTCDFKLDGAKWFGKVAARIEVQHGSWYLVSVSPLWSSVKLGGTVIKKQRKLSSGDTINIRGQRFRFELGESS